MGRSKTVFKASVVGFCGTVKKLTSYSLSISGRLSVGGGDGGTS